MNKLRISVAFNLFKVSIVSGYFLRKGKLVLMSLLSEPSFLSRSRYFQNFMLDLFLIMISASKDFTYLLMSISSVFKWILIIDNRFLESCDFHSALKYYLLSQFTVMHCELWMGSINLEYTDPRPTVSWTIPSTDIP